MKYADVLLPVPLEGTFTYAVPSELERSVQFGVRAVVEFGASKIYLAIIIKVHDDKPPFKVKPLISVLDTEPILLPRQFELWKWLSDYYLAPLGDIYNAALPAGLKEEKQYRPRTETYIDLAIGMRSEQALRMVLEGLKRAPNQLQALLTFLNLTHWDTLNGSETEKPVKSITREELMNVAGCSYATLKRLTDRAVLFTYEREVGRLNDGKEMATEPLKTLSEAQQKAYEEIREEWKKRETVLLHGVTSSGKTEVYIHLIRQALQEKKQVLYLLPEIALTVQITNRLKKVFGSKLGIYHSRYSDAERVEIWKKQLSSDPYQVVLGARSAVFLPYKQLGLIIVDEEHESSFKQQDPSPRYHARSAAIVLAGLYGAKTVLGTATPSMESYHNAVCGKYGLVKLGTRYKNIRLPAVEVVDVADLQRRKMMSGPFSPQLIAAVRDALGNDRQVILFQNRRGFAPLVECRTCGWVPKCRHCDVSLTVHKQLNLLTCHYCGFTERIPSACPCCGEITLNAKGFGTEKVEQHVRELFAEAKTARMDLDTTRTRGAYERLIDDFSCGRTNLLIGTQMISKGLDFDRVSVVGILDADMMLNFPDFRAYENTFNMLSQVSGRAGRKGEQGKVILQTRNKDSAVIRQITENDYAGFFHDQSEERRMFRYPPYYRLIYVYLRHRYEATVERAGVELGSRLRQWFGDRVLGPDKPSVARIKNLHIRKLVLKLESGIDGVAVRRYLREARQQMSNDKRYAALQVYYDVDPLS